MVPMKFCAVRRDIMTPFLGLSVLFLSTFGLLAQNQPSAAQREELPKLMHLSADQVNPQVDPCTDFSQYTCSKFFASNPIPPDRAAWGVIGPLAKWHEITLRQGLEARAAKKQGAPAAGQNDGDYRTSHSDK